MRAILFRGIRKDNGEWIYGDLVHWWGRHNAKPDIQIYNNVQRFNVIPETVGQYTGLTDKNGKKIFERDIVKYGDTINKVVFEQRNGTAYFGVVMGDTETWHFCYLTNADGMEVIGNVHDNPELLGGE